MFWIRCQLSVVFWWLWLRVTPDPPEWPEMLAQAQEFLAARQALSDKTQRNDDA